ncbi:hypothetical protein Btru_029124 [Bulinus truncatus]|nr:hypothetical protein Btru_029124 [Bulinus truncatus]
MGSYISHWSTISHGVLNQSRGHTSVTGSYIRHEVMHQLWGPTSVTGVLHQSRGHTSVTGSFISNGGPTSVTGSYISHEVIHQSRGPTLVTGPTSGTGFYIRHECDSVDIVFEEFLESQAFGSNSQYKCHCDNQCKTDGTCDNNGKCQSGWFGLKCQYQDLVTLEGTTTSPNISKLLDRDDKTCLETFGNVIINFNRPFVFTWLRLVVNNECRNVALKQETWQTSDYVEGGVFYNSSLAVEGDVDPHLYEHHCTHTSENDKQPMWTVRFKPAQITRYVLYNRCYLPERLRGFTLMATGAGHDVFSYKDNSTTDIMVYTVLDSKNRVITDVRINSSNGNILTLCEVQVYGECPSGTWGLDCQKCSAQCPDTCHIDDGSCNTVCYGFKNPPFCDQECDKGFFGINCTQKCPANCIECNSVFGQCVHCKPGFFGENCREDLASAYDASLVSDPSRHSDWLIDNDDFTCNTNPDIHSVMVKWNQSYPFTWLRIVTLEPGFNAALRQKASQSSIFTEEGSLDEFFQATNAVDGDKNSSLQKHSCTHTQPGDPSPTWSLVFDAPVIAKIFLIYNRYEVPPTLHQSDRLHHFLLLTLDVRNNTVFNYRDTTSGSHLIYQVAEQINIPIISVQIKVDTVAMGDLYPILTLCEVEIYAELSLISVMWTLVPAIQSVLARMIHRYACQPVAATVYIKSVTSLVVNVLMVALVSTIHHTVHKVVLLDSGVLNCGQHCSSHCVQLNCHGQAEVSVYADAQKVFSFPDCTQVCQVGFYGRNCTYGCSQNCVDGKCDPTSGHCYGCIPGYFGEYCDLDCNATYFGQDCLYKCSSSCLHQLCHPTNGTCLQCPIGKGGDDCHGRF